MGHPGAVCNPRVLQENDRVWYPSPMNPAHPFLPLPPGLTVLEHRDAKQREIEAYEGVLARRGQGRWGHTGKTHLEALHQELIELENRMLAEGPTAPFKTPALSPTSIPESP